MEETDQLAPLPRRWIRMTVPVRPSRIPWKRAARP